MYWDMRGQHAGHAHQLGPGLARPPAGQAVAPRPSIFSAPSAVGRWPPCLCWRKLSRTFGRATVGFSWPSACSICVCVFDVLSLLRHCRLLSNALGQPTVLGRSASECTRSTRSTWAPCSTTSAPGLRRRSVRPGLPNASHHERRYHVSLLVDCPVRWCSSTF